EDNLTQDTKKVLKAYLVTLIPAVIGVALFGKYVLLFYGPEYSQHGSGLLTILAISSIPIALNTMCNIIVKIKHMLKPLILVNLAGSITTLSLGYFLIPRSFLGIGWAWLLGQLTMSILYIVVLLYSRSKTQ